MALKIITRQLPHYYHPFGTDPLPIKSFPPFDIAQGAKGADDRTITWHGRWVTNYELAQEVCFIAHNESVYYRDRPNADGGARLFNFIFDMMERGNAYACKHNQVDTKYSPAPERWLRDNGP